MAQGRSTTIISMIKWIRTSRLPITKSLSSTGRCTPSRSRSGTPTRSLPTEKEVTVRGCGSQPGMKMRLKPWHLVKEDGARNLFMPLPGPPRDGWSEDSANVGAIATGPMAPMPSQWIQRVPSPQKESLVTVLALICRHTAGSKSSFSPQHPKNS